MIVKLHCDIPTHENEQVNAYAQCERQEALEGLCEDYGYPSALVTSDGVELVPKNILLGSYRNVEREIQEAVGGLVLELMAFEKEWNSPDRWRLVEQAVSSNNFVEP